MMRFKAIYVVFTVCLAILWKLSFANFAFFVFQNNSLKELVTTNSIFKVAKKRRRSSFLTSGTESKSNDTEDIYAEKTENEGEDSNDFIRKIKLLFTAFFTGSISYASALIKTSVPTFSDDCFYGLASKKYLSISILRI